MTWWNPLTWGKQKPKDARNNNDNLIDGEVLIAGGQFHAFTAGEDLEARQAVKITGDYVVGPCDDITEMYGVSLHTVKEGEELTVVERPATIRVEITGEVDVGKGVRLQDSRTWVHDDDYREYAVVQGRYDDGTVEMELRPFGTVKDRKTDRSIFP